MPARTQPRSRGPRTATVNETIDFAAARKAALANRLPGSVVLTLVVYAAGILGQVTRRGSQASAFLLFILLTLAITLILDLDRPRTGSIVVSQASIKP
jgi:hypothetical protein